MSALRNFKITLAYDGTNFFGWQAQPEKRTVQSVLEETLSTILGHFPNIIASGRTDTGVHALGQVINVCTESTIPCQGLLKGLNSILPDDVKAQSVEETSVNFHARYMAKSKIYAYAIYTTETPNPFLSRYSLHVPYGLDIPAMKEASKIILGEHDFASFMATGSSVKNTLRTIMESSFIEGRDKLYYVIEGSGFLRHMVRNIVGTLLLVGRGSLASNDMEKILDATDRTKAGPTAPANGLYLVGVRY
jgi:tRNA pseudouridine38-40 synthase